jgi:hypothetical protein
LLVPSLRNPVGPLPSSIYWRRRLVVLVALAAVLVLILWLLLSGGGGGENHGVAGPTASHPAVSITPGGSNDGTGVGGTGAGTGGSSGTTPTPSGSGGASLPAGTNGGTVVSGGSGGSGTGGSGANGGGTGGSSGGSTGAGTGGTGGSGGGSGGSSGGNAAPPANASGTMNLPVCAAADVELALTSTEQTYDSTQWPTFQLAITNTTAAACRVDLGAKSAVLTVSSDGNNHVWSSGDCPKVTTAQWYAVPAAGADPLTAQFLWSRTTSAPGCTPGGGGGAVGAGTYVARIGVDGVPIQPAHQFRLAPIGS